MFGTKILEETTSKYNGHIRVVKTLGLGTYIQVEGLTQSGGVVEDIWKETLRKVRRLGFSVHGVLILGLGGGSAAKWVRKLWPGAKIVGVEIDPVIIEAGKRYLDLGKSGVEIKMGDAFKFLNEKLKNNKKKYDLIINDVYLGYDVPKKIETENYINLVKSGLSKKGVAVFNRLYFGEKRPEAVKFGKKLENIFTKVDYFYPEANLMFVCQR